MADDVSRDIPQLMARAESSLSAARLLIDMFDERQLADYGGAGFNAERAEVAYQNATAFVEAARDYFDKNVVEGTTA